MRSVGWVLISLAYALSPYVDKPLKSVTHGQCDARPMVTFPVTRHRCRTTGAKLYCLVTEAHVCEQAEPPGVELVTCRVASQDCNHYTMRPQGEEEKRREIS